MKTVRLLKAEEIEVKVKQVTAKGAVALLYKTARVDMDILDETYGAENWETDYKEIKGNLYCGIGVRAAEEKPFVWKWDCGIESREDGEGNQKKGEASDAFKRAGVKWGIGRELYSAPFIFLPVETEKVGTESFKLKDRFADFNVTKIIYDENRKIKSLSIADKKGEEIFLFGYKSKPFPEIESEARRCEFCQKPIAPYSANGKVKTAEEMAEYTKKKYGHELCAACASKLAKELK